MTVYVIRLRASGTYLEVLPGGVLRHVALGQAREFEFATTALAVAVWLGLATSEFDIVPAASR